MGQKETTAGQMKREDIHVGVHENGWGQQDPNNFFDKIRQKTDASGVGQKETTAGQMKREDIHVGVHENGSSIGGPTVGAVGRGLD